MKINLHQTAEGEIAELNSESVFVSSAEEGTDLTGSLYFQGFDKIILHEKNISPAFFDLKTGIAGEILQKFSNYRMKLAVVGDFSKYKSQSLSDFIRESNRGGQVHFLQTTEEAIGWLAS